MQSQLELGRDAPKGWPTGEQVPAREPFATTRWHCLSASQPKGTVHLEKTTRSYFSEEQENLHFYALYIKVLFYINKYKFGGKSEQRTQPRKRRGITVNVLGTCLNHERRVGTMISVHR